MAPNKLVVFYFTLLNTKSSGYPRSHADVHTHFSKISKPEHAYAVFSACFKLVSEAESFPDKAALFRNHQTRKYDAFLERLKLHPECPLQEMQQAYTAALDKCHHFLRSHGVQFLFVVDEARGLLQDQSIIDGKVESPFVIFGRACKDLPTCTRGGKNVGSFVLFIDTNAKVSNFSPSSTEDPSARVNWGMQKLFGPLSRLPTFNLSSDTQHSELEKIAAPEVLFKHGRPLWAACKFEGRLWERGVIDLAQTKLLGGLALGSKDGKLKLEDANMALALLGRRIAVDVSAQSTNAQVLVASHMLVCLHTSVERDYVLTQALPEPVLAEAAAELLRKDHEDLLKRQLKQLNSLLLSGIASAGERGEVVARFLLLNAMDTLQVSGGFTSPQSLERFLLALIPGWKGFTSKSPSNLRDAKVFFNAFYPFFGDPTIEDIKKFVRKAGAMICKQGTEAFDLYIPLLFPGYDLSDDSCIGCLGIQVKNRKQVTGSSATMDKMQARQKYLAWKGNQVVPNMLMLLQLGAEDVEGSKSEEALEGSSKTKRERAQRKRQKDRKSGAHTEGSEVLVKETFSEVSFILESRSALLVPKHLCEVVTTLLCERPQPLLILQEAGVDETEIRALKQIMEDLYPADAPVTKGDVDTQLSARVYTKRRK